MSKRKYFDGAMGTIIKCYTELPSEHLNISNPELILNIHREYIKLGVDCIKTNSFNIKENDLYPIKELVKASIAIANKARAGTNAKLAFSIGPTKKLETYEEIILSCVNENIDYYLVETMINLNETKKIIDLISLYDNKPIILSFVIKNKRLLDENMIEDIFTIINLQQVEIIGVNCIDDYEEIKYALNIYHKHPQFDYLVMPNSGHPISEKGKLNYGFPKKLFESLRNESFKYLGGCCGIDFNYLRKVMEIDK